MLTWRATVLCWWRNEQQTTMKAIKIDPYTETITEVELPEPHEYTEIYRQLGHGCDTFTVIDLGNREALFLDDEGLLKIKADAESLVDGTITRFFILLDGAGRPTHLIAGCGLILGSNRAGGSISTKINIATIKKVVGFISADNSMKAAQIADKILNLTGVCTSIEELHALQTKQLALVAQAAKLIH